MEPFGCCRPVSLAPLLEPIRLLGVVAGLVALVGGAVALVGGPVAVTLVGGPLALVGDPLSHISGPLAGIGKMVAVIRRPVALIREVVLLVSGPLTHSEIVLGPVQGRLASSQPRLGRLECLLGLPGPRLGRPDPGVVQRLGRDPLTLGVLDHLQRDLGQLARGRPGPPPQPLERLVQADPLGGGQYPLGLLDPDPAGQRLPQLAHFDLAVASSTAVWTSSAVTRASAPRAWTSAGDQARGWLAYTFKVPTGWSPRRTGTLNTPRTCSWRTTTVIRSHTCSPARSCTATTRSSA